MIRCFGTYGEHRKALELNDQEHLSSFNMQSRKVLISWKPCAHQGALSLLKLFTPDYLKVASRDLTNEPLLEVMGETKIPIIVSTGDGKFELQRALEVLNRHHEDISILHCVSEYPTRPVNVNLNTLKMDYKRSSQSRDRILRPHNWHFYFSAVAIGAQIIEKHITLDRRLKGKDQAGSLERRLCAEWCAIFGYSSSL